MNIMTADFEFVLPLIIIIGVIASLIDKAKKASEEAKRQQVERERRMRRPDLPEVTRRQIYGEADAPTVRRAKPLVIEQIPTPDSEGRNDTGEGTNDEGMPVPPVQQQRRPARPVAVPAPPPSTPWGELRRTLEEGAKGIEREVRRQMGEAQRRQGGAPPQTEYDREQQRRRQRYEAEQAQRRQATARRGQPEMPRPEPPRVEAPRPQQPPVRRATQARRRAHPLLGNMSDVRRAIVLREVLGPPKAFE